MTTEVEIDRALAAVTASLNEHQLEDFEPDRVQALVTESVGGQALLKVDAGGGLHDVSGSRVGAVRRTDSGEWLAERQNETAGRSETAIPAEPPQSKLRWLR